jgi:hydroxymethylbilane synthase
MTSSSRTEGTIRIGTRGSRLARWQAEWVARQLRGLRPELNVELVEIKTHGDRDRNSPLSAIGGIGVFTKEIQRAVRDGEVDVAVHSLKDLPTQVMPELFLAAVPAREDVADALIAPAYQTIDGLRQGARVGTSSPRRRAQLLYFRPDLQVVSLRGNVETRLNQALDGTLDAVVLAWAGLHRLGLEHHVTQRLDPLEFMPAVGQGALGIECRRDDTGIVALLELLNDPPTHRAVVAERAALAALEGGCTLPVAAWARDAEERDELNPGALAPRLVIDAAVFDFDGRARIAVTLHGPRSEAEALGQRAAEALRKEGAIALLERRAPSSDLL